MPTKPLLNKALEAKLLALMKKMFGRFLRSGEVFRIAGHEIAPDAWMLSVVFENRDKSLHLPLDLALVASENPQVTNDDASDILLDFVGYFFERYFRGDRQVTLPLDWQEMPFGDYVIRARGWEHNRKLEEAADRLLAGLTLGDEN